MSNGTTEAHPGGVTGIVQVMTEIVAGMAQGEVPDPDRIAALLEQLARAQAEAEAPVVNQGGFDLVLKAIQGVMADVDNVPKKGWNDYHKYHYVLSSDLLAALQPACAKHGLIIFPTMEGMPTMDTHGNTHIVMNYRLAHVSGQVWPFPVRIPGAGNDKARSSNAIGDKGVYKAMTGAQKYYPALYYHHTSRAIYAANRLEELAALDLLRGEEMARLHATPEYQALLAAQEAYGALPMHGEVAANLTALDARRQEIVDSLQRELDNEAGAIATADGGVVGFKVEKSFTYKPESIRRLLPDYAKEIIKTEEKVVFGVMQSFAKAAVKAGKAPKDVMDLIREEAEVQVKKTWTCKPGKNLDRDAALARLQAPAAPALEAPAPLPDAPAVDGDVAVSGPAPVVTPAAALTLEWEQLGDAAPLPDVRTLSPGPAGDEDEVITVPVPAARRNVEFGGLHAPTGDIATLTAEREMAALDDQDEPLY